jgi:hypothetical protein
MGWALLILGAYILAVNAWAVYAGVTGRQYYSPIPLLGGVLAAIGLAMSPFDGAARWWPVPLFLDSGGVWQGVFLLHHWVRPTRPPCQSTEQPGFADQDQGCAR